MSPTRILWGVVFVAQSGISFHLFWSHSADAVAGAVSLVFSALLFFVGAWLLGVLKDESKGKKLDG